MDVKALFIFIVFVMSTEKTKYSLKQSCSFGGNTFCILVSILKEILADFFVLFSNRKCYNNEKVKITTYEMYVSYH